MLAIATAHAKHVVLTQRYHTIDKDNLINSQSNRNRYYYLLLLNVVCSLNVKIQIISGGKTELQSFCHNNE